MARWISLLLAVFYGVIAANFLFMSLAELLTILASATSGVEHADLNIHSARVYALVGGAAAVPLAFFYALVAARGEH